MEFYFKFVAKIRNNKTRIKKAGGIVIVALGFRYANISESTNLSSNSTQQIEQVQNFVEEDMQVVNTDGQIIKTGSGILVGNKRISEGSKSALEIRSGELGKSGPGPRAKSDAHRNAKAGKYSSGSTIIPGSDALIPQNTYCRYHKNEPLSCKPRVKLADGPFQSDGDNNQPPSENGNFDASQYKGGPSPFIDKFDYDNSNYTRENTKFSNKKRMSHSFDGHAEKCFGIHENRNKKSLQKLEKNLRGYIESPETERINGSYRYETPAYHYKKPDQDLIVTVNATNNEYISVRNATDFQLEKLEIDGNLGYDSRPSMSITLRLRGPKQ